MRPPGIDAGRGLSGLRLSNHRAWSGPSARGQCRPAGQAGALLGAWLIVPHVARLIAIVVFCIMAGFMFYFLFAGAR